MNGNDEIIVFGREDAADRGMFDRLQNLIYGTDKVSADDLRARLNHFLAVMQKVVEDMPAKMGEFNIDAVTITAEISAKGQVVLLGTGGELAGKGGITFTLKRPPAIVSVKVEEKNESSGTGGDRTTS